MRASMFSLKNLLGILACLVLDGGGICLIILAFNLPTKLPFAVLGHVSLVELIVAGVALITLSLVPLGTYLNRANLTWKFCKPWRKQTVYELGIVTADEESFSVSEAAATTSESDRGDEMLSCSQTLVQFIQDDPRIRWNGQDIDSLIRELDVEQFGGLVFPPAETSEVVQLDKKNVDPAPETLFFDQNEVNPKPEIVQLNQKNVDPAPETGQLDRTKVDATKETFYFLQSEEVVQLRPLPSQSDFDSRESICRTINPDQIGFLTFPLEPSTRWTSFN